MLSDIWVLSGPVWSWELGSRIPVDLFQLTVCFYEGMEVLGVTSCHLCSSSTTMLSVGQTKGTAVGSPDLRMS